MDQNEHAVEPGTMPADGEQTTQTEERLDWGLRSTPEVVGVCFRPGGKIYHFDPGGLELRVGDTVLTETSRGRELGRVIMPRRRLGHWESPGELKPILRQATPEDMQRAAENEERRREAHRVCTRLIEQHALPMRLREVEYAYDGAHIIFSFSAEERVDFRALLKDLRQVFACEIELRQVGVRDEARALGGYGSCGRPLCCATFMRSFEPVSIRMAKDQGLSLNPTKISGACGRLMCCLRHEHTQYREARRRLPKVGARVRTPDGEGEVTGHDVLQGIVIVRVANELLKVPEDDVESLEPLPVAPRPAEEAGGKSRRRKRPRRRPRSEAAPEVPAAAAPRAEAAPAAAAQPGMEAAAADEGGGGSRRRRRRPRRRRGPGPGGAPGGQPGTGEAGGAPAGGGREG